MFSSIGLFYFLVILEGVKAKKESNAEATGGPMEAVEVCYKYFVS